MTKDKILTIKANGRGYPVIVEIESSTLPLELNLNSPWVESRGLQTWEAI